MTLTDKEKKKKRLALQTLCNRIASAFSFKSIKTWEDVYVMSGTPDMPQSGVVTYPELKQWFEFLKQKQEESFTIQQELKLESSEAGPTEVIVPPEILPPTSDPIVTPTSQEEEPQCDNKYGLPINPHHNAFLFWFQQKAVKVCLDGMLGFDVSTCRHIDDVRQRYLTLGDNDNQKQSQCLLAATGTGKTFISAAIIHYLYHIGFHEGRTYGPSPYLYVTKATIVEQTKRVFTTFFNLGLKQGVEIINIEQLRSRAGEMWIKEETVFVQGEEVLEYKWKKIIAPCVIFWDESQGLKNEKSTQSKIAQSYNLL